MLSYASRAHQKLSVSNVKVGSQSMKESATKIVHLKPHSQLRAFVNLVIFFNAIHAMPLFADNAIQAI